MDLGLGTKLQAHQPYLDRILETVRFPLTVWAGKSENNNQICQFVCVKIGCTVSEHARCRRDLIGKIKKKKKPFDGELFLDFIFS